MQSLPKRTANMPAKRTGSDAPRQTLHTQPQQRQLASETPAAKLRIDERGVPSEEPWEAWLRVCFLA
jgi:hypothetical protein